MITCVAMVRAARRCRPRYRSYSLRLLLLLLAVLSSLAGRLAPAEAARFFHGETRKVRACNLLLPATARTSGREQNPSPFLFFALDRRTDIRPDDWEFVNPLAPPTVTAAMDARWRGVGSPPLTPGIPLTKDLAPYWEVTLRPENLDQLVTMDICYLSANGLLRVTHQEREMLRRIVDAGVLLWLDDAGGLQFPADGDDLFFPVNFTSAGGTQVPSVPSHPLLNGRFRLTASEMTAIGILASQRGVVVTPPAKESTGLADPTKPGLGRTALLTPLILAGPGIGGAASVAAAQYGSGFILATARNVGAAISGPLGPGPRAGANLTGAQNEDLKLAYNAVGWTDAATHMLKDPRRTGASGSQLAGFLERWSFTPIQQPIGPSWLQPLIVRNQVIAALPFSQSNPFGLFSLATNPGDDFNGDGKPDDGPKDLSWGQIYDEINRADVSAFSWISGLSYGEIDGVGYVFVSGGKGGVPEGVSAGTTFIQAFTMPTPENPNFNPVGVPFAPISPPSKDVNVRNIWSAPAFHNGLLIAGGGTQGNSLESGNTGVGAVGDMRAVRLVNGQLVEQWHYPQGNAPEVGPIVGPVVVANIFDERSGATDTMVLYTSLTIASSPGGLGAIVMHTAGEPLGSLDDGRTWAPTRRVENWDPNQWFDIRVIDNATGLQAFRYTPATQTTQPVQINVENQPGRIRLPVPYNPTRFSVVAEYSLLNTREGTTGGVVRRYWMPAFNPPGGNLPSSGISAGPSVDAYGNAYIATGNGYIASLRFAGGATVVNWKARVLAAADGTFLGQQHVWEPYKQGRLSDHLFVSTPAWKDGILYTAGRDGIVYAFETRDAFTVKVPFSPGKPAMSPNRPLSVVLYSNESEVGAGGEPPRTNRVPPDAFTVNADAGTITINNMRNVTLDLGRRTPNRMPELGNRYGIPINVDYTDIHGAAQQDITYIPLNLLYAFQTGSGGGGSPWKDRFIFETSPVVAGDRLFIIGNRRQSGARNELGPAFLFQLPADPRRLDNGFLAGEDIGSWVSANPGSTRQPGWMVDARPISASPVLAPPTLADDLLLVATAEGVVAYKAARVLVADANRILEVGTDGKVAATMDSTQKLVAVGSDFPIPTDPSRAGPIASAALTAVAKNLDRPAAAKRLNRTSSIASIFYSSAPTESGLVGEHSEIAEESLLIADTGNNRVVETNPGGKVIWELTSFQDPFRLLPPGEPLKLADPVDVQRWVDTEQAGGETVLVIHTLVADAGNTRVIEIVDKVRFQNGDFGPNTYATIQGQVDAQNEPIRWHHVLVWTSQTNAQGLRLRYRTAQRVYAAKPNGDLIPNPGVSPNQYPRRVMDRPPYLPMEPYESRTMAVVSGSKVFYVENQQDARYGDTLRNLPQALPGGDSIVFLKSNRTNTNEEPFWRRDTNVAVPNGIVYVQGTVGRPPDYPLILEILDAQGQQVVHQLNGVTSLQRTLRVNLADRSLPRSPSRPPDGGIYYLIADASGVFEFRHDPTKDVLPPTAGNPFPRDLGVRLAWKFTNDDYNWVTGGGSGNPDNVRSEPTGRYTGGRTLTASSARLLTNGQVLIASRTAGNPPPGGGPPALTGEVYTLRINDYARAPASGPFWIPDLWVQQGLQRNLGLPSITWRAPSAANPLSPPLPMPGQNGFNPLDLGNTYIPDQPAFADLVF
jgi:hypothetical protein